MEDKVPEPQWYQTYANIVVLTSYMAENGHHAQEIAYAVAKPWKHEDLFRLAEKELQNA